MIKSKAAWCFYFQVLNSLLDLITMKKGFVKIYTKKIKSNCFFFCLTNNEVLNSYIYFYIDKVSQQKLPKAHQESEPWHRFQICYSTISLEVTILVQHCLKLQKILKLLFWANREMGEKTRKDFWLGIFFREWRIEKFNLALSCQTAKIVFPEVLTISKV